MALRPIEFHILLALADDERHGYAILQEVAALTEGELQPEPGTLYRALHRMLKDGWVVESARRPAADVDDERRRYYRLTPLGRRAAVAEAARLARRTWRCGCRRSSTPFATRPPNGCIRRGTA